MRAVRCQGKSFSVQYARGCGTVRGMDPKVLAETMAHLARRRWKRTTKAERRDALRQVAHDGWITRRQPGYQAKRRAKG